MVGGDNKTFFPFVRLIKPFSTQANIGKINSQKYVNQFFKLTPSIGGGATDLILKTVIFEALKMGLSTYLF